MWGLINTKNEIDSSKILNEIIPEEYRIKLNNILVAFGQTICKPRKQSVIYVQLKNFVTIHINTLFKIYYDHIV